MEGGHVADETAIKGNIHRNFGQFYLDKWLTTLTSIELGDLRAASQEGKEVLLEMLKRSRHSDVEFTLAIESLIGWITDTRYGLR